MKKWKGHTMVLGRTGSGKTWHVVKKVLPSIQRGGVFFWNGGHENVSYFPISFLHCSGSDNIMQIKNALFRRKTIIYTPSIKQKTANAELSFWQQILMSVKKDITVIIDEVARVSPQGSIDTPCHLLATAGRRWGLECIFITQRVADVSKTIVTQCQNWIIFEHSNIDRQYLLQRGLEISKKDSTILNSFKYKYLQKTL